MLTLDTFVPLATNVATSNTPLNRAAHRHKTVLTNLNFRAEKSNNRLIRRMSSSIMGLNELCKLNISTPYQIKAILQEGHQHTKDDISKLQTFLTKSQLYNDLKEENLDIQIINKLLVALIYHLKLETFDKKEKLFSYGDTPSKIYILLQGNIRTIILNSIDYYCNGFEYFSEIMKIQNNSIYESNVKLDNMVLLEQTLQINYHIYPIERNDLYIIKFIIFNERYTKYFNKDKSSQTKEEKNDHKELNTIIDLLRKCYLTPKDFNIKYPLLISYLSYIKSAITSELNQRLSEHMINKYSFLHIQDKKKIQLCSYKFQDRADEGAFIGHTSKENPKYTEYAIIKEHSFLVSIPFDIYHQLIHNEREKIKTKEVGFLLQVHIFSLIHFRKFKRSFFNDFLLKQYNKGDYIIKDSNKRFGKVYIIKEGEVQITIHKSIFHLFKINQVLYNTLRDSGYKVKSKFKYDEKELKSNQENLKPMTFKLLRLGEKDIFGNGMIYFDIDNCFNVIVQSEKAKVYEINQINFMKIGNSDKEVKERFKIFGQKKLKNLLDRIENIIHYVKNSDSHNNEIQLPEEEKNVTDYIQSNNNNHTNENNNHSPSNHLKLRTMKLSFPKSRCLCKGNNVTNLLTLPAFKRSAVKDYLLSSNNKSNTIDVMPSVINKENNSLYNTSFKFRITKKDLSPSQMNKQVQMLFEDKLLKTARHLVNSSCFINDNSINKNYFSSSFSNFDNNRLLSKECSPNKEHKKAKRNINILNNNNYKIYLKINKSSTITPNLSMNIDFGETTKTHFPCITDTYPSKAVVEMNNKQTQTNFIDEQNDEVLIEPKNNGIKGKKLRFNYNRLKLMKNNIYKTVLGNKLGY